MKSILKYVSVMFVLMIAGIACARWIPDLNLEEKITVDDQVDYNQEFIDLKQGMLVSQAFVPGYEHIESIKVYIDITFCDKANEDIEIAIEDRMEKQVYQRSISRQDMKDCGWQEAVSDVDLKAGEIYYLKVSSDDTTDNPPKLAITDAGKMCTQIVYAEGLGKEDYTAYYLLVILLTGIILAHIFKKQ